MTRFYALLTSSKSSNSGLCGLSFNKNKVSKWLAVLLLLCGKFIPKDLHIILTASYFGLRASIH